MRRVTKDDIQTINSWYAIRGMQTLGEHLFPDIGFIVDNVGAGFIYQTDSSLCFLDGYVSNPGSTKDQRKTAFDSISNALILTAKAHGFSQILAYTKNSEIRKRCERFQFMLRGDYTLYCKEL